MAHSCISTRPFENGPSLVLFYSEESLRIRVSHNVKTAVTQAAKKEGVTPSQWVRDAVESARRQGSRPNDGPQNGSQRQG